MIWELSLSHVHILCSGHLNLGSEEHNRFDLAEGDVLLREHLAEFKILREVFLSHNSSGMDFTNKRGQIVIHESWKLPEIADEDNVNYDICDVLANRRASRVLK